MRPRVFIAVLLICVGIIAFCLWYSGRQKQRAKYTPIMDEAIRTEISNYNLNVKGYDKKWMEDKAFERGYGYEQMIVQDLIYKIENNGGRIEGQEEIIPGWLLTEFRKRYGWRKGK